MRATPSNHLPELNLDPHKGQRTRLRADCLPSGVRRCVRVGLLKVPVQARLIQHSWSRGAFLCKDIRTGRRSKESPTRVSGAP
jgi:hypothetical protein